MTGNYEFFRRVAAAKVAARQRTLAAVREEIQGLKRQYAAAGLRPLPTDKADLMRRELAAWGEHPAEVGRVARTMIHEHYPIAGLVDVISVRIADAMNSPILDPAEGTTWASALDEAWDSLGACPDAVLGRVVLGLVDEFPGTIQPLLFVRLGPAPAPAEPTVEKRLDDLGKALMSEAIQKAKDLGVEVEVSLQRIAASEVQGFAALHGSLHVRSAGGDGPILGIAIRSRSGDVLRNFLGTLDAVTVRRGSAAND